MQSVNELCEKGNSLSEVGMYQEALSCFKHALEITPETYDYEDERVWILVAIGDTLFQLQQYSNAMEYLRRAYFYDPGKYSLQGTTQGNGLTGGLPPVRFSM